MAADPSYYHSGVSRNLKQKEHCFLLYMNQRIEAYPDSNQKVIVNPTIPNLFGVVAVNDWTVLDGPGSSATAKIVARARGMQVGDGKSDQCWLLCHSIIFTDSRFAGSSLKVLGDFSVGSDTIGKDGEWAIVGGSGEFAYAHGAVAAKIIQHYTPNTGRTWELRIRAFCLCPEPEVTKVEPAWGGNAGSAFDVPEPPVSLQSVTVRHGDVIDSIAFTYTDKDGQTKTAGPWGGDGGVAAPPITLGSTEYIKQVLGTTTTVGGSTFVSSLTLVSNVTTYGPYGKSANGTPFSTQIPEGKTITGFYARAGAFVVALGVYYA